MITVEGLEKKFSVRKKATCAKEWLFPKKETVPAVKNVNFTIETGEMVAFIGPNGAGKSTTIKMLTGIVQPTKGTILVDGLNPSKQRKELAYHIGCMFGQRSSLFKHLTVQDSLQLLCSIYDLEPAQGKKRIEELATQFAIEEHLPKVVKKLSLGQRMICELAASMLHHPDILFLDEPTIGLDVNAKERIRTIIRNLNETYHTTVFLTSHDVGDVEALCNRMIVINNGTIVKDSSMEEIKEQYLRQKTIIFSYQEAVAIPSSMYSCTQPEKTKLVVTIDSTLHSIPTALSYFSRLGILLDVQIESLSMEEMIKAIYEEGEQ